mgnify:CR=1 FL=1
MGPVITWTSSQPSSPHWSRICLVTWSISGTVALDSTNGVNQRATLTGDLTLDPITGTSPGDSGNILLDNTGSHIFSVGAWKIPVTIDSSRDYISLSWANQNGDLVMYGGSYD